MDPEDETNGPALRGPQRQLAWSVHLFTACGVVCCLFSLEATIDASWRAALTWLMVAVAIDAVDGTLARMARVKQIVPEFDGALLDNLIDYVSYVIVPALIIHRAELLPSSLSFGLACSICLASSWQFCQSDAKTTDHYFKGFPSYWNIVAFYLLAMNLGQQWNALIVAVLVVLVFVPIKYIYISRNAPFPRITWPLTLVWSVMGAVMVWQLPNPDPRLLWGSFVYIGWYTGLSLFQTFRRQ